MNNFDYYRSIKVIRVLFWFLFGCSLVIGIVILLHESNLTWSFDGNGFSTLYSILDVPIKFAVGAFGVLAVWLTLGRMSQTERQIEKTELQLEKSERQLRMMSDNIKLVTDNNRFTNYYRHMDEFFRYLSQDPTLITIKESYSRDSRKILTAMYKYYYCSTYNDFNPNLSEDVHQHMMGWRKYILNSPLNKPDTNFFTIPNDSIKLPKFKPDEQLLSLIESANNDLIPQITRHLISRMNTESIDVELFKFVKLSKLYWSYCFYVSILAFDGHEYFTNDYFKINFRKYQITIGIDPRGALSVGE